jgi:hypothetical protein
MNRHRASAILTERLDEHPAVLAWVAATSHETVPEAIHVLRERGHKGLYWLPGLAPGGAAVFAKRAVAPRTLIERTIYEDVLPHLQLTAPHYYGSCVDDAHGWLFVEDVGDRRYSKHEPEHLALAARWFGTFHLAAGRIPAARTCRMGPARAAACVSGKARASAPGSSRDTKPLSWAVVFNATRSDTLAAGQAG